MKPVPPMVGSIVAALVSACVVPDAVSNVLQAVGAGTRPLEEGPHVREFVPVFPDSRRILQEPGAQPAFSPDGTRYAVCIPTRAIALGAGDGKIFFGESGIPATTLDASSGAQPWWSPDGRHLGIAEETGADERNASAYYRLVTVDTETGTRTAVATVAGMGPWMAFSPDGKAVLYRSNLPERGPDNVPKARVYYKKLGEDSATDLAEVTSSWLSTASGYWLPDGRRVVIRTPAVGFDGQTESLVLFDLETGTSRFLRRVPRYQPPHVLIFDDMTPSPDGSTLGYLLPSWGQGAPLDFKEGDVVYAQHEVSIADGSDAVTPFSLGPPAIPEPNVKVFPVASRLSPDHKWCTVSTTGRIAVARELATGRQVQLSAGPIDVLGWTADSTAVMARAKSGTDGVRFFRVQVAR